MVDGPRVVAAFYLRPAFMSVCAKLAIFAFAFAAAAAGDAKVQVCNGFRLLRWAPGDCSRKGFFAKVVFECG